MSYGASGLLPARLLPQKEFYIHFLTLCHDNAFHSKLLKVIQPCGGQCNQRALHIGSLPNRRLGLYEMT